MNSENFISVEYDFPTLNEIVKPIYKWVQDFENAFISSMRSDVHLINAIANYILEHKGKRLRPILVFLSADLCDRPNEKTLHSAILVELLHTATLIHDDVVDGSEMRRGSPSVNSIWKNKTAVLMGDFLFSLSLQRMIELGDMEALQLLSSVTQRMSKGELIQIEKSRIDGMNEEVYFQMIRDKTASLFSSSCELGAITTTGSPEHRKLLREYGENIGIAFQIKDDLFDFTGREKLIGKPIGRDIKENIITLPLIYSFANSSGGRAMEIFKAARDNKYDSGMDELIQYVHDTGGIEYAEEKLFYYSEKALKSLKGLRNCEAKDSLISIVKFNIHRKK